MFLNYVSGMQNVKICSQCGFVKKKVEEQTFDGELMQKLRTVLETSMRNVTWVRTKTSISLFVY